MTNGASIALPVDLHGCRVAITAGANGIGKTIADAFVARGASVFVSDIDDAALVACRYPHMRADAGRAAELEAFMDGAIGHLGGLDVLVNNAGIAGPTARIEDLDPAALDATLQVDLAAMFHCARHAVPALRRAGGGCIVNMSSSAGRFGFAQRAPYAAAKWGVIGLTKSLSIELGPDRIRVNAILPGLVDGPRQRAVLAAKAATRGITVAEQTDQALSATSLRCFVTQQDIANMILYLCSPFGATISGQALAIDGDMQVLT